VLILVQCTAEPIEFQTNIDAPIVAGIMQNGTPFRASQLKGKVWLASYFFTSCQTVCPALNSTLQQLHREYPELHLVSITSDPSNDTWQVLKTYSQHFAGNSKRWFFLTMPQDSMRHLAVGGFKLMNPETPEMHSTRIVLIDEQQKIRHYYDSSDTTSLAALRSHLTQIQHGVPH
jgi:protein SCO1